MSLVKFKLTKNKYQVLEGNLEEVFYKLRKYGARMFIEVDFSKKEIKYIKANHHIDHVAEVIKGVRAKQIEDRLRNSEFIDDPNYKFCNSCKRSKKLEFFGKRSRSSDGYNTQCKQCVNIKQNANNKQKRKNKK